MPAVLSCDEVGFMQNSNRSQGDVFEIPDWGCDQIKCAHPGILAERPTRQRARRVHSIGYWILLYAFTNKHNPSGGWSP